MNSFHFALVIFVATLSFGYGHKYWGQCPRRWGASSSSGLSSVVPANEKVDTLIDNHSAEIQSRINGQTGRSGNWTLKAMAFRSRPTKNNSTEYFIRISATSITEPNATTARPNKWRSEPNSWDVKIIEKNDGSNSTLVRVVRAKSLMSPLCAF